MTETDNLLKPIDRSIIVESKKKHPCGSNTWEVLRAGADIKLKCSGCNHIIIISRQQFNKQFKEIPN